MKKKQTEKKRIYWMDNLRTFMIFLVVLIHTSLVYEKYASSAAFWIIVDPSTSDLPGIIYLILNIFVIGVLFFIAGYFVPLSLKRKKAWNFIKSKFKRLMVPWTIAVLTLIPLYKIIFLFSRNLSQENWTTYFHWNVIWTQNWLWFLPVLFLFQVLYVLFSKLDTSNISLKKSIFIVFIISVIYNFCIHFFGLVGWTKTLLLDFENDRLLIYFMMFLLGSQFYKLKIFEKRWINKKLDIIVHSTGWIPMTAYIFMVIYALMSPDTYIVSKFIHLFLVRFSFVLSITYWSYVMITTFYKYFNKQGKLASELNKNSYYVYIIHVIVMGAIALSMLGTSIPSLLKFLILTITTYAVSNLLVSIYRKIKQIIFRR